MKTGFRYYSSFTPAQGFVPRRQSQVLCLNDFFVTCEHDKFDNQVRNLVVKRSLAVFWPKNLVILDVIGCMLERHVPNT